MFHFLLISNPYLYCRLNSYFLDWSMCYYPQNARKCLELSISVSKPRVTFSRVVCSQSGDIQLTDKDTRKYWHLFLQNVLIPMTPARKQLAIKLIDDDYSANQYIVVALRQTCIFSEDEKITWDCRVNPHQPQAGLCTSTSARHFSAKIFVFGESWVNNHWVKPLYRFYTHRTTL